MTSVHQPLVPVPLEAKAFAPFGEVIEAPSSGRSYFDTALANLRTDAKPSLSIATVTPTPTPLIATRMERHEFSSQSFVPMDEARWIVIVAPHDPAGKPDMAKAKAFLPAPGQGITYHANIWHHPMTVFDDPARFAIVMWLTKVSGDEEFVDIPVTPIAL